MSQHTPPDTITRAEIDRLIPDDDALAREIFRRYNTHAALVAACEHASMSYHHPACRANPVKKNHKQDQCGCHVEKARAALKLATEGA